MNAFKQGVAEEGGGNCASIAFIKMAIGQYGVGKVFKKGLSESESVTTFILKDGNTISLTNTELERAIRAGAFVQNQRDSASVRIKQYADTCFAVMCKRLQLIKQTTFDSAILDLNFGHNLTVNDPPIQSFLGLSVRRIDPHRASKIRALDNIVVYNYHHAAYAAAGYYDEVWNASGVNRVEKFKFKRWSWKCGYKMCGLSGAFEIIDQP